MNFFSRLFSKRWFIAVLVGIDASIVCLAFFVAFRIRTGEWDIFSFEHGLGPTLIYTLVAYLIALFASGIYRIEVQNFHLRMFIRASAALLIAWPAAVTLTYLVARQHIPPRSVTVVHWMLSLIGVLSVRAVMRSIVEWQPPVLLRPIPEDPELSYHTILQRKPIELNKAPIQNYLSSRTVLVTGAGGSIGCKLSKLLVGLRPFRLVLVDVSEYNLFLLENELRNQAFSGELIFRIADVRDKEIMRTLFSSYHPDIIFHAAAYKHVPLMERHPIEAFRNNTLSTVSLIKLCEQFETEQFILISTDKAVNPTSVLGATKRLAEWYVRAANSPMARKIVRFGNVFGSQGSAVEIFLKQIKGGGPVTVTHPDMERYFMSTEDACGLILQTMLLDSEPPVYMLQMGEPVKIGWLAQRMIKLFRPDPNIEIPIEYTGLRPGERLQEELLSEDETPTQTSHPSIVGLSSYPPYSRSELDTYLNQLLRLCSANRTGEVRKALFLTELHRLSDIHIEQH